MAPERFSLKDHLFNEEKVSYLGALLEDAIEEFDREEFESSVMSRLPDLGLKQRIAMIAEVLADHLHPEFAVAAKQIAGALPPPLDPAPGADGVWGTIDDDYGDFIFAPFGKYVEDHGTDHYEISMALLRELTMRMSMEGPVRRFIDERPSETLQLFEQWAHDANYHVRRLVSESTRPLLPWAPRISLQVSQPIPLLDLLHDDPTRYVTRSVANHLNDVSKIDPDLTIETLTRWRSEQDQSESELEWMTGHALRTLVKQGNPGAMRLLGYSTKPHVTVGPIAIETPVVPAGEALRFSIDVTATRAERLLIDYSIDFVRKNGSTRGKVFKLKKISLDPGESVVLSKNHPLRADATTYTLYSGTHGLTVMVNGRVIQEAVFDVTVG